MIIQIIQIVMIARKLAATLMKFQPKKTKILELNLLRVKMASMTMANMK
jgi:hypothetical protein